MPDEFRSPIKHHLVLHRVDPVQGIRRFYSLMAHHKGRPHVESSLIKKDRYQPKACLITELSLSLSFRLDELQRLRQAAFTIEHL